MTSSRRVLFENFLLAFGYCILAYVVQLFLHKCGYLRVYPNDESLMRWDAGWYWNLLNHDYSPEHNQFRNAFYILFPWFWKLTHLGTLGISILNMGLFGAGFALLLHIYKIDLSRKLILLTLPAMYFVMVPYAEALFFFLSSLMLWALHFKKTIILWLSFLLLSFIRPVTMVLIPAFLIMELITEDRGQFLRSLKNSLLKYAIPLAIGWGLFTYYQYIKTGVWFAFFKAQEGWEHVIGPPVFPLSNLTGPATFWVNALALFAALISIMVLFKLGFKWLLQNERKDDKLLTLSHLYIAAIGLICVLFNPEWSDYRTSIHDAYRYTMVAPFFFIFIIHYSNRNYNWIDYVIVFVLSNLFWLVCGSYFHILTVLYFNFVTLLILIFMSVSKNNNPLPTYILITLGFFLQIMLFQNFLLGFSPG